MNTLNPGEDFEELPETYVIFITKDDVLRKTYRFTISEERLRKQKKILMTSRILFM